MRRSARQLHLLLLLEELPSACSKPHSDDRPANTVGGPIMTAEFQVQKTGLQGREWKTVCRAPEAYAREVFQRQLQYYSVGRFRLLGPDGRVLEERAARPLFSRDAEPA
jgi:hypothetical protein